MTQGKNLTTNYAVLSPKGLSETLTAESFWKIAFNPKHPKNNRSMGYLVSTYEFDEDWKSWECHPHGDEVVYCVSGALTFLLEKAGGNEKVALRAGQFFVIPKNTWHTALVKKASKALFITWGYGTKHRDNTQTKSQGSSSS